MQSSLPLYESQYRKGSDGTPDHRLPLDAIGLAEGAAGDVVLCKGATLLRLRHTVVEASISLFLGHLSFRPSAFCVCYYSSQIEHWYL